MKRHLSEWNVYAAAVAIAAALLAAAASASDVIINEWSQGDGGAREWIELLVVADNADLRGYTLNDDTHAAGEPSCRMLPAPDTFWRAVPRGTLIVIYNGEEARDPVVPTDDTSLGDGNYRIVAAHNNEALFEAGTVWNGFANTTASDNPKLRDNTDPPIHDWDQSDDAAFTAGALRPGAGQAVAYMSNTVSGVAVASAWRRQVSDSAGATPGRPNGAANSLWIYAMRDPHMRVLGNGTAIANGDASPAAADGTDFASASVDGLGGSFIEQTFTVTNSGAGLLTLTGTPAVVIGGPAAADFSVVGAPADTLLLPGDRTDVTLRFEPTDAGMRAATVTIPSNDSGSAPFVFAIAGIGSTHDGDSAIAAPASQPDPGTIAATADTPSEAEKVLDVRVTDAGSGDALPTRLTRVTIRPAVGNMAAWSTQIGGARLSTDGGATFVTATATRLSDAAIEFTLAPGALEVPDGAAVTVSMFVWLKAGGGAIDGATLRFGVDGAAAAHGFRADAGGSQLRGAFPAAPAGNAMQIDVNADRLVLTEVPASVSVNAGFRVTSEARDANGNVDRSARSADLMLVDGDGNLSGAGPAALFAGSVTWSNVQYDAEGLFTVKATAAGLTPALSGTIVSRGPVGVGDITIIGYRSDAPDGIAFVTWVDLPGGVAIHFTDNGWSSVSAAFRTTEDTGTWEAPPGGIPAGSVVVIVNNVADTGTFSGQLDGLSNNGDQVFAFRGTLADPILLFGLDFNNGDGQWDADSGDSNASALPDALNVPGGNFAIDNGNDENGQYTGKREETLDVLWALVASNANWTVSNNSSGFGDLDSTDFVIAVLAPPSVTITNPAVDAVRIGNLASSIRIEGTANIDTIGYIEWRNAANGASGRASAGLGWAITFVPLDVGANTIIVTGSNRVGETVSDTITVQRALPGGSGPIIVTEFMKDPDAASDSDAEWVELYNRGPQPIDIGGWSIRDTGLDSHIIAGPFIIQSGEFVVLGASAMLAVNGGTPVGAVYTNINLGNADDAIILRDAENREVVRVAYDNGVSWPEPAGAALMLRAPGLDLSDPRSWMVATTPWPGSAGDFGTPGRANVPGAWPNPGMLILAR